jgi:predicted metal-dependent hydrolase
MADKHHEAHVITPKTITVDGVSLSVVVERKRIKNVNARLRGSTLAISAPHRIPDSDLDRIIVDLARRLLRRAHAHAVNREEDAVALAQAIATRFRKVVAKPLEVREVRFVTTQQARWGSYSQATGTIRLNAVLRRMPRWVLESVVAHELAHVVHQDHSPAFWSLARQVYPDTDRARAFLAGVAWLGRELDNLPPVERALLGGAGCDDDVGPA